MFSVHGVCLATSDPQAFTGEHEPVRVRQGRGDSFGVAATVNLTLGLVFGLGHKWLISVYVICTVVVWVLWAVWRWSKYAGATVQGDGSGAN